MKKGFTLIELLVVVLIIGILSAVALPQYTKAVQRARVTEIWNYCTAFREAQRVYHLANGEYTGDLANLDIQMPELKYFSLGVSGYGGSSATAEFNSPTYFPSVSMSCWVGSNGRLERFSCYDSSHSKKCVPLMLCSNPAISAGCSASCDF